MWMVYIMWIRDRCFPNRFARFARECNPQKGREECASRVRPPLRSDQIPSNRFKSCKGGSVNVSMLSKSLPPQWIKVCWKVKFAKEWRRSVDIWCTERGKEGERNKEGLPIFKREKKLLKLISREPLLDWDGRRGNTVDRWEEREGRSSLRGTVLPVFCP